MEKIAYDTMPLTWDEACTTQVGMLYADDGSLFNQLQTGRDFILKPIVKSPHEPPYWLKLIPCRPSMQPEDVVLAQWVVCPNCEGSLMVDDLHFGPVSCVHCEGLGRVLKLYEED